MNGDTGTQINVGQKRNHSEYYWIIITAVVIVVLVALYLTFSDIITEPSKAEKRDILNQVLQSSPENSSISEAEKLRVLEELENIEPVEPVGI